MARKRQEHPDAEHGEPFLATSDDRLQRLQLQAGMIGRNEMGRQQGEREEVNHAIGRQVFLFGRRDAVEEQVRQVSRHCRRMAQQGDGHREYEIGAGENPQPGHVA
ncbi:hypothetical protein ABIF76_004827 [Bradyrhizobium ottawaense]